MKDVLAAILFIMFVTTILFTAGGTMTWIATFKLASVVFVLVLGATKLNKLGGKEC